MNMNMNMNMACALHDMYRASWWEDGLLWVGTWVCGVRGGIEYVLGIIGLFVGLPPEA